jgi:hypothetical protein
MSEWNVADVGDGPTGRCSWLVRCNCSFTAQHTAHRENPACAPGVCFTIVFLPLCAIHMCCEVPSPTHKPSHRRLTLPPTRRATSPTARPTHPPIARSTHPHTPPPTAGSSTDRPFHASTERPFDASTDNVHALFCTDGPFYSPTHCRFIVQGLASAALMNQYLFTHDIGFLQRAWSSLNTTAFATKAARASCTCGGLMPAAGGDGGLPDNHV